MKMNCVYKIFYSFSDKFFKDWSGKKEQNDPRSSEWGKIHFRKILYISQYICKHIDLLQALEY